MNDWSANCLVCGNAFDTFTSVQGKKDRPDDGAISLCLYCGAIAVFVNGPFGLGLREPTPAEATELMADPDIRRFLAARTTVVGSKP